MKIIFLLCFSFLNCNKLSQEYYTLFIGNSHYKSNNKMINDINLKKISLISLRSDFPVFSLSIEESKKKTTIQWLYNFCLFSLIGSERSKTIKEIKKEIYKSHYGFVQGVNKLLELNHNTFSQKDKKWISNAKLWISAYESMEVENDN